tara:strand:+ start:2975 stop:3337 length:363 start_codon:yes stop_codon:yes gene_type:complete
MIKLYIKYIAVGIINTIFGVTAYLFFLKILNNYFFAITLSTLVGVLFNYVTYSKGVFKSSSKKSFIRFIINYSCMYVLSLVLIYFFLTKGLEVDVAGAISIIIISAINFFTLKAIVYAKH